MKRSMIITACLLNAFNLYGNESITGHFSGYREICETASKDSTVFQNFRSLSEYRIVLELTEGESFANYLTSSPGKLLESIEDFRKLDLLGNPPLINYPILGPFTGTTLRYIVLADQIKKIFSLPNTAKIAEIGAGFGGQSYILSKVMPFSKYYFFDLPEVEMLIAKVIETLNVSDTICVPYEQPVPEDQIDLVISNYAFSECDRNMQMLYFENVIKKATRGYIIYNHISKDTYNIDSLTKDEFVQLLKSIGLRPKVMGELLSTAPENFLITWDRTKQRK